MIFIRNFKDIFGGILYNKNIFGGIVKNNINYFFEWFNYVILLNIIKNGFVGLKL